jgi:sec-independent protein translocase protein TatA
MLIIGAVALIAFGPDQLPKVARKAGQAIRDVQNTSQSFIREMERAADEEPAPRPSESPRGTARPAAVYEDPRAEYAVPGHDVADREVRDHGIPEAAVAHDVSKGDATTPGP